MDAGESDACNAIDGAALYCLDVHRSTRAVTQLRKERLMRVLPLLPAASLVLLGVIGVKAIAIT